MRRFTAAATVLWLAMAVSLPLWADEPGSFVVWTNSPYVATGPSSMPPPEAAPPRLAVEAAINEYEHVVLNVTNLSPRPLEFELEGRLPGQVGLPRAGLNLPIQQLAAQERNPLRAKLADLPEKEDGLAMPLVELDSLGTFFVPASQTRQLWLTVQTRDLEPGFSRQQLRVVPLAEPQAAVTVPVDLQVWNVRLDDEAPIGVFCFDYAGAYRWLKEHKINVWFRGAFPPRGIKLDEEGNLAPFETDIKRVVQRREEGAEKFLFSYGYSGSFIKWAEEQGLEYMSPRWQELFREVLARMVREWKAAGLDYDDFALQTIDEAHEAQVEQVIETTPLVRQVDPNVRTAMTIMTGLEELEKMAPHVDVWVNRNGAIWSPEQKAFFDGQRREGKPIWSWNMPGNPKSDPLTQFRTYGWRAMKFDFDAIGFFLYSGVVYDPFRPGGGFSTRHWEAWRDGVEDYQLLWTLGEEIRRAGGRGAAASQLHAAEEALARAVDDVLTESFFPPNSQETHDRIQAARREVARRIDLVRTLP